MRAQPGARCPCLFCMAVARDRSVLASLAELRMFEQQRVAEERAALRELEVARVAALAHGEATRRAEQAAQEHAHREHVLAFETARTAAAREARIRSELAAMAERERLADERAAERAAREHELARETALRQRPTWMVTVTVLATIAAVAMVYVGLERRADIHAANARRVIAERETGTARVARAAAVAQLDQAAAQLGLLGSRVSAAEGRLAITQTAADRAAAQADLGRQRVALAAEQARLAKLAHDRELEDRRRGVDVTGCVGSSLCAQVK